jgi:hydrogenase maturation protein HypF
VYPFEVQAALDPVEADLRPALRAAVQERLGGVPVSSIAAAFHNTVVQATAALVRITAARVGQLPVVAGGGCFQNARLASGIRRALSKFDVRTAEQAPPGDGGIALGQAVVADAIVNGGSRS